MKNSKIKVHGDGKLLLVSAITALVGFIVHFFVCAYTQIPALYSLIVIVIGYFATIVFAAVMLHVFSPRKAADPKLSPLLGQLMVDVVLKLHMPVLICDMDGKVIWYNRTLSSLAGGREVMYGMTTEKLCGVLPQNMVNGEIIDNLLLGGRAFCASGYEIKAGDKEYRLVIFNDLTDLQQLRTKFDEEDTIVMYVIIDNLDELLQHVQEKYRTASAEIAVMLKKWAEEMNGMIKEYERDKFIIIINKKHLLEQIEKRFSILDEIRDVRVGEGSAPVTVSIGVACIDGTLAEKSRAAQSALDMALQRGGDQAVLKREDGIDFYGGRTRTVQKRTKVRARVIANELITHMSNADNVLIMGHKYADFDSFGACIGIARLAEFCGVPANIVVDTNDENVIGCINKFRGVDMYDGKFIDSRDGLDLMRTGTMLVIVDVNNVDHFESPQLAANVDKIAIIDHHRKTAEFKREPVISYIEPSASSCCELISEMLEQSIPAGMLIKEEADMLLAGMLLDTKQFSRNTGTRTFSAAQYLRSEGAAPSDAQELFKTSLDDFVREAKFESDVVIYRKIIAISRSDVEGAPQDRIAAAKAADKLLGISGIQASFALVKIGNSVHISARSTGKINVQLILEKLQGGGHFDVAGAQVADRSLIEALTMLKESIDHYLDNNM